MLDEAQSIWWQVDCAAIQLLAGELQAAAEAVTAGADELVRRLPSGAGLAVEAQRAACQELVAQARTAAGCLASAGQAWRVWLADFDVLLRERAAALATVTAATAATADAMLSRDPGSSREPTPQEVRETLAALLAGAGPSLWPLTGGLLTAAYARLRAVDESARIAQDAAAQRMMALLLPTPPATVREALAAGLWWQGLLPLQRDQLLRTSPGLLGQLDGLPVSVRDTENRLLLSASTSGRMRALNYAVRSPGAALLQFDPHADGTAVVALGDLASSRHVAVLVPGMANEIDDVGRLVSAALAMLAAAPPGESLAVVAWLGYDTPRVTQVASARQAIDGAGRLTSFVRSLRITAPHADVTVIGHSYGTLVAGEAARRGMFADRLVFVGSPGVDAARASDLLPAGQVWAARAPDDPIRLVFGSEQLSRLLLGGPIGLLTLRKLRIDRFGPDPTGKGFGAKRFSVAGSHGHSAYFRPGSTSVRNLTLIATGRPADIR